ncbi:uncharacterized protein BDR25DRAFT_350503 [Lindgomyces ingoldianus]|uniref:Uncharacterized protein n=1 Tax=Lindgomyces ingoldianus TaxID=673940 RepID=A0ACB6R747_9PLEO|nr:uncharacterized protein BDR25DRAFT_350503 [Lindgomyces ingoldianus]KAF2475093.1 hypothetical protein BDR25DRAFT_350503 [Lindgomyces ingoldianus]
MGCSTGYFFVLLKICLNVRLSVNYGQNSIEKPLMVSPSSLYHHSHTAMLYKQMTYDDHHFLLCCKPFLSPRKPQFLHTLDYVISTPNVITIIRKMKEDLGLLPNRRHRKDRFAPIKMEDENNKNNRYRDTLADLFYFVGNNPRIVPMDVLEPRVEGYIFNCRQLSFKTKVQYSYLSPRCTAGYPTEFSHSTQMPTTLDLH